MEPATTTTVDLGTLESHLWEAANILRGPVDASDFKTFIFPLLFFKRVSDVYDEEYAQTLRDSDGDIAYAQFAENHRFLIPDGCHWSDVRSKTTNVWPSGRKRRDRAPKSGSAVSRCPVRRRLAGIPVAPRYSRFSPVSSNDRLLVQSLELPSFVGFQRFLVS